MEPRQRNRLHAQKGLKGAALKYLLEEIPRHIDEHGVDFCEDLLPCSDKLPAECRK